MLVNLSQKPNRKLMVGRNKARLTGKILLAKNNGWKGKNADAGNDE
jgi:hypothetical protein